MTLKTKQINTGKSTILVVDLPKWAKNPVLMGKDGMSLKRIYFELKGKESFVEFPKIGIYSYLIGFAENLTEEQVMDIVPNAIKELHSSKDYINSILKYNGVVTVNPYGEEQPHNYGLLHLYPTGDEIMDLSFQGALKWQQAEQELWTNPVILLKQH